MVLQMKKALITTGGIEVNGDIYTCSLAIKEQWFSKVMETGPIEVDFYLNTGNQNEGILSLNVGYESCLRVEHAMVSEEEQAKYFERLEQVKHSYLQSKIKRRLIYRKGKGRRR